MHNWRWYLPEKASPLLFTHALLPYIDLLMIFFLMLVPTGEKCFMPWLGNSILFYLVLALMRLIFAKISQKVHRYWFLLTLQHKWRNGNMPGIYSLHYVLCVVTHCAVRARFQSLLLLLRLIETCLLKITYCDIMYYIITQWICIAAD